MVRGVQTGFRCTGGRGQDEPGVITHTHTQTTTEFQIDRKMNTNVNSDVYTTIAATLKFDEILRTVQSSNLNFRVEMSPFSAIIHMKYV